jgi:hypothetical protein
MFSVMSRLVAIAFLAATVGLGLTGCFGSSTKENQQAAEPLEPGSASTSGVLNQGCSYIFHNSVRYLSITNRWEHMTFRWDRRPSSRGSWSGEQQQTVDDNATVDARGLLTQAPGPSKKPDVPSHGFPRLSDCFKVWNGVANQTWRARVAGRFKIASLGFWQAVS